MGFSIVILSRKARFSEGLGTKSPFPPHLLRKNSEDGGLLRLAQPFVSTDLRSHALGLAT